MLTYNNYQKMVAAVESELASGLELASELVAAAEFHNKTDTLVNPHRFLNPNP
jgi:hypothetical protein